MDNRELEKKIGYNFKNKKLLTEALTHSSYANERQDGTRCNERLEFLGDSVLGFISAEHFFHHFKHLPEGELTKRRAYFVCEKSLSEFARTLGIGDYLLFGKGEVLTGGKDRPSILADAFEAVLAAIYLDGGIEPAKKFVFRFIDKADEEKPVVTDYKTTFAPGEDDFRERIHPKKEFRTEDPDFYPQPYYQVFQERLGFLPNLSIADLLFNMGPESLLVLQASHRPARTAASR